MMDKYTDDIKGISKDRLDIRKQNIKDEYAKAKEEKREEILGTIRQNVVDSHNQSSMRHIIRVWMCRL